MRGKLNSGSPFETDNSTGVVDCMVARCQQRRQMECFQTTGRHLAKCTSKNMEEDLHLIAHGSDANPPVGNHERDKKEEERPSLFVSTKAV